MAILFLLTLVLLAYTLYSIVSLRQRVEELEDIVHGLYHDVDIKIDEIKSKIQDGETIQ